MLLGALPPVANAKDDGYVLYSEDGVEMKKMKREFFTADVERVGCDYWKEGTGEDLQNEGGKLATYRGPESGIDGDISWLAYLDDDEIIRRINTQNWINNNTIRNQKENYIIYNASEAKKYKHYGDFWVCFKLREGEQEVNSNYFVCGDRSVVDSLYYSDPSQTWAWINSVSRLNGYPVSIMTFPGTPVFRYRKYIAQVTHLFPVDPIYDTNTGDMIGHHYDRFTHLFKELFPAYKTAVSTYNRQMGFGFHGIKSEGLLYSTTIDYKNGSGFSYISTPPITHCDMWTYQYGDPEIKRTIDLYYMMDEPRDPEAWPEVITWNRLYNYDHNNPDGILHSLWKLGVGDTVLEAPSLIQPKFYHILPIANTNDRKDRDDFYKSLTAPRGVLRSIPVVGVESYTSPVYDGYKEDSHYSGGSGRYFYLDMERYYSAGSDYYQSIGKYDFRDSDSNASFDAVSSSPHYYVNDFLSEFIHNNVFAMSRKGFEIRLCKRTSLWFKMNVGCQYLLSDDSGRPIYDVSDLEYNGNCYYTSYGVGTNITRDEGDGGGGSWDTDTSRWEIEKYGDGNLEINKVRVDTSLMDYSYYPPMNCDYVWMGAYYNSSFKSRFTATDDYIFDTNHTLNVIRNIPNPETGAAYDEYSLRTLWKMNININGVTRYSLDTTFPNARPQVMKLNFNPNTSTNYGFGNEFSIDTTNNKVSRLGVRVDSNKVRRAGEQDIRGNCLIMRDNTGAYQSIRLTGSDTWANQGNTSAKFRPENIYYCTRAVEKGTTIYDEVNAYVSPLYNSHKHIYYSDVCGWSTPYTYYSGKPLYLVGTIDSEGWFSVVSNMYDNRVRRYGFMTQDLPTSADGLYYIYLGRFIYDGGTYSYFELEENHPIYYYKYGRINEYHYRPQDLNDFVVYENAQSTPVSAVTNRGEVDLRFSGSFNNTWDETTGMLTIGYWKQALPKLSLTPLVINEETAATNIASSSYVKACDVEELLIEDSVTAYYIDFNVIFRTTDGTPMTDGTFEAMLSWSANPNYGQDWVDGTMGEPLGYFKAKRVYAPNENEIVLKMKGYFKRSAYRGAQYPYIVVKHTCSTNMDVGYSITGYQTAYSASS